MSSTTWTKIFRTIWRINGAAILLLLVIATFGILATFVSEFDWLSRSAKPSPVPSEVPKEPGKPELFLGEFRQVGETSIVEANLSESRSGKFSSSGGEGNTYNILYIDTTDGRSWWLFPNSDSVIDSTRDLSIVDNGEDRGPRDTGVQANLFQIVATGDESGTKTLILANAVGTKQIVLRKGTFELEDVVAINKTDARIFCRDAAGYHVISVNPTEITKLREVTVPLAFPPRK